MLHQTRSPGGASEAKQDLILTVLNGLLTELAEKIEAGQAVELGATTLAALETIQATVSGSVSVSNFPGTQAVSGTVDLSSATLAALESVQAAITGTVALDAPTLAALESITATIAGVVSVIGTIEVSNLPATYPLPAAQITALTPPSTIALDAPTLAALEQIQAAVTGTVALDPATLAALEAITVSGTVALDAPTLAALESITAVVSGTVALDAGTLAALESITATVSGTVGVSNFPAEFPLPAGQVSALTPQTDALTDAELRAAEINVADSGEREYTHVTVRVTSSGDTTIHTPGVGKAVRLRYIYAIADPAAVVTPEISVSLGTDRIYLGYAIAKRQLKTGAVNAPLKVNLSSAATVLVTAILEEV